NSQKPECPNSLFPPANQSVAAIVFGDGSSSHTKLYPLTKRRSEAAIPIAGNYRLIDAVVSNCINSDITKIYALTQFNSTSLNSHISRAYSGARLPKEGFVEVIAAYQSPEDNGWFQGSADAIRKCLWVLEEYPVTEYLVLPGHHLYKMDYQKIVDAHRRNEADITVSVFGRGEDGVDFGFGIFEINAENQVLEFRHNSDMNATHKSKSVNLGSMGIYVINRDVMIKLLTEYYPTVTDLKTQVIPGAISLGMKIHAYQFDGYWEDMRSIEAYYRASMETIRRANKAYNFFDRDCPLYTLPRHLPPTLVTDAVIIDSVIGDGCFLSKCRIKGTVIGMKTRIGDNAVIEDSIIMGSDTYPHVCIFLYIFCPKEHGSAVSSTCNTNNNKENRLILQNGVNEGEANGIPIGIGEGSHIRKAIIDKNARIGKNVTILNKENVQEGNMEENGYIISGGIVVVIRNAVIPDGTIL
ncbi:hypothetical protein MIMGU_mgv1a020485mg, partial [Erythranthe guttata]